MRKQPTKVHAKRYCALCYPDGYFLARVEGPARGGPYSVAVRCTHGERTVDPIRDVKALAAHDAR